jgi:hypothetical protein
MSDLVKTLIDLASWLARLTADLVSGKKTEDEARAELIGVGLKISETDSDAELAEYVRLMGGEPE